jgi:hypothetical protein
MLLAFIWAILAQSALISSSDAIMFVIGTSVSLANCYFTFLPFSPKGLKTF